jgi:hypothetical protein
MESAQADFALWQPGIHSLGQKGREGRNRYWEQKKQVFLPAYPAVGIWR